MKCIRCDHDSKYKDRTDRKCPNCGGRFAFEPKAGDPLTDPAFKRCIDVVSAEGRVRWGVEHLYYEVARRRRLPAALSAVLAVLAALIGALALGLGVAVHPGFLAGLLLAAVPGAGAYAASGAHLVRIDRDKFRSLYDRWVDTHGAPAGVITRKPQPAARKKVEADVGDYSFDRAVICDRARTVDLLLANNFHFENNCAVLAVEGYPAGPFETVRAMLKRNPRLQVYALHDATPGGCALAHRLATDPAWFAGQVKVIDVGLRPSHAEHFPGLLIAAEGPRAAALDGVTAWEAEWLSCYALEVAAVRPEQVLKRLFRAINQPPGPDKHPGPVIYLASREKPGGTGGNGGGDGGALVTDAGDADGPADSFG